MTWQPAGRRSDRIPPATPADDVWARAAADRSGLRVGAGVSVVVLLFLAHGLVRTPLSGLLGGLSSAQRALVGLGAAAVLWAPLLLLAHRTRGTRAPLPLWAQAWIGYVFVLSGPAWMTGRMPSAADEAVTDAFGWTLGVLLLAVPVLGPTCLWLTMRRRRADPRA